MTSIMTLCAHATLWQQQCKLMSEADSSLYTIGRITASFVQKALSLQQLQVAVRYREDLLTIQSSEYIPFAEPVRKAY